MDSTKERFFFISGLISLSFFALLVLLVGYSLLSSTRIEQFAMVRSDTVSISVALSDETPQAQPQSPQTPPPAAEPEPKTEAVEETKPQKAEPVPEISDLFSQVKPKNEPKKPQESTKRNEALAALEKELSTPTEKQRFTDRVKNIELSRPGLKMVVQGGSTGPVVNEYHAKIQGLVYTHFHPPAGSQGQAVRVRIRISAEGKLLSFRVMAYSSNPSLNQEVDWLKERLETVVFPNHPENREAHIEVILMPKE
jgi:protein TonB